QVTSASTNYTNNVTNAGGTPGQFDGLIVLFRNTLPSTGFLQSQSSFTTGASSLTATLPFNVTSGGLLVATVSGHSGAGTVSSISGCSATWVLAATGPSNDMSVYYAMNVPSGSCTATANFGSSQAALLTVSEYKGQSATYAVEVYQSTARTSSPVS